MWHKAIWKGHPMRVKLTHVGLLDELANHCTCSVAIVIGNGHDNLSSNTGQGCLQSANIFGKGMDPTILFQDMGK